MKSSPMVMALILVIIPVLVLQIPLFADAGLISSGIAAASVLVLNTIMRLIEVSKPVLEQSYRSISGNVKSKTRQFWLG